MIEFLTPEQEADLVATREKWLAIGRSVEPLNRPEVTSIIRELYKRAGKQEPQVWFFDSPMQCVSAANLLKEGLGDNLRANLRDNLEANLGDNLRDNLWANLGANLRANLGANLGDNLRDNLGDNLWANLRNNLRDLRANLGADLGANLRANLGANLRDLRANLGDNLRANLGANLRDNLRDNLEANLGDNLRDNLWANLGANLGANLRANLGANLRDNLWANLGANLRANLRDLRANLPLELPLCFGGNLWSAWKVWADFGNRIGAPFEPKDRALLDLWLREAAYCHLWFPFEKVVLVSERPREIHLNPEGRLHNPTGIALKYRDGWGAYAVNGVRVPAAIIEHPEEISAEQISSEVNAEIRRVMLFLYGEARYLQDSGAKCIHKDEFGELFQAPLSDDEPLTMIKVRNSTPEPDGTHKDYFLRVHPELRPLRPEGLGESQNLTAKNAVASLSGLRGEDYNLIQET